MFLEATREDDKAEATKLLFLLPCACGAAWAGRGQATMSRRVLESYPNLSPELSGIVMKGLRTIRVGEKPADEVAKVKAVKRHLSHGHARKAASVLMSDGLAEMDDAGLEQVQKLHPDPIKEGLPWAGRNVRSGRLREKKLTQIVKKLPRQSAAGVSGWSFAMIQDAWANKKFVKTFVILASRLAKDKDVLLREWFCSSRLIPLNKKGGGVRPIAIGESFTRLACKWSLAEVVPIDILMKEQFGVGSAGGVEPVVWSVADAIEDAPGGGGH